jgi:protein-S-isoprenylcysteine O-methyltransferase Ste14
MLLGIPIALVWWWGLLLVAKMPALRVFDEEGFLARNPPGYVNYQKKVRLRLMPLLW